MPQKITPVQYQDFLMSIADKMDIGGQIHMRTFKLYLMAYYGSDPRTVKKHTNTMTAFSMITPHYDKWRVDPSLLAMIKEEKLRLYDLRMEDMKKRNQAARRKNEARATQEMG